MQNRDIAVFKNQIECFARRNVTFFVFLLSYNDDSTLWVFVENATSQKY